MGPKKFQKTAPAFLVAVFWLWIVCHALWAMAKNEFRNARCLMAFCPCRPIEKTQHQTMQKEPSPQKTKWPRLLKAARIIEKTARGVSHVARALGMIDRHFPNFEVVMLDAVLDLVNTIRHFIEMIMLWLM